jgi:hypothetical protein
MFYVSSTTTMTEAGFYWLRVYASFPYFSVLKNGMSTNPEFVSNCTRCVQNTNPFFRVLYFLF